MDAETRNDIRFQELTFKEFQREDVRTESNFEAGTGGETESKDCHLEVSGIGTYSEKKVRPWDKF